jgi:hypothetical protein
MRVHFLALGLAVVGGAVAAACGGETQPNYGPPNGLVGVTPPTPGTGSGSGSGSSTSSGSGGGSGSSSGTASSGGGDGGSSGASSSGGGDGGINANCTVSWANTVYPSFTTDGMCSTAVCHGGTNAPTINANDPTGTYTTLTKYTINGKAYIAAGDTNPADSAIECNMSITTPACGIAQMPEAPGALNATDRTNLETWLACGSPNN